MTRRRFEKDIWNSEGLGSKELWAGGESIQIEHWFGNVQDERLDESMNGFRIKRESENTRRARREPWRLNRRSWEFDERSSKQNAILVAWGRWRNWYWCFVKAARWIHN